MIRTKLVDRAYLVLRLIATIEERVPIKTTRCSARESKKRTYLSFTFDR